jgi:putative transposase
LNYYDNAGSLTKLKKEDDYTWIKEVNSQSVQASLRDLEVAYTRFFSKQGKFYYNLQIKSSLKILA